MSSESAVPSPVAVARVVSGEPADGVAAVSGALGRLAGLDELPCGQRVAVFESVHEELQDILATVDDA